MLPDLKLLGPVLMDTLPLTPASALPLAREIEPLEAPLPVVMFTSPLVVPDIPVMKLIDDDAFARDVASFVTGPDTTAISPPCTPLPALNVMLPPMPELELPDSNFKDPPDPSSELPADITEMEPPAVFDCPVLNKILPETPEIDSPVDMLS